MSHLITTVVSLQMRILLVLLFAATSDLCATADEKITFDDHIQPIFRQYCLTCHSANTKKSDLAIDAYASALEGGASGEVIVPGSLDESRLWLLVTHEEEPTMPPEADKLPDDKLQLIRQWIEGGALENSGSVADIKKKPGLAMLGDVTIGKPEGPAAMPKSLLREPIVYSHRAAAVTAVASSPWAPLIAVAGQRQVLLYHSDSAKMLGVLPFLEGVPQVLAFSRDGSRLLAAGGHGATLGFAVLYDVETGSRIVTVGDGYDSVLAADVNALQTLIALGGPQKVVRVYDTSDGSVAFEIRKHTDWITAIAFSPDGKLLLTADRNGGALLWEAETGREVAVLRGHAGEITSASWRTDSKIVATAGADGTVRLWGPEQGNQIKSWPAHGGGATSVNFSADGRLVSAGRDNLVKLWKGDGGHLKDLSSFADIALAACFSHDGKRVAAGDFTGELRLLDVDSAKLVGLLPSNPPTLAMRLTSATAHLQTETNARDAATTAKQQAEQTLVAAQTEGDTLVAALGAINGKLAAAQSALDGAKKTVAEKIAAGNTAAAGVKQATATLTPASAAVATAEAELSAAREASADTTAAELKLTASTEQVKRAVVAIETAQAALKTSREASQASQSVQATASGGVAAVQQQVEASQTAINEHANRLQAAQANVTARQQAIAAQESAILAANQSIENVKADQAAFAAAQQTLATAIAAAEQTIAAKAALLTAAMTAQELATGELATRQSAADVAAKKLAAAQAEFDAMKKQQDKSQATANQQAEATRAAELAHLRAQAAATQAKADKELFEQSQAVRADYVEQ